MTVIACLLDRQGFEGELDSMQVAESLTERFAIYSDTATRNIPTLLAGANAVNSQFPLRGGPWPVNPTYGLFAGKFKFRLDEQLATRIWCDVAYGTLGGKPDVQASGGNPLLFPATYELEYIEYEEVVAQAKNVQPFGVNTGPGQRAALTLGPIVNSAHAEFEEAITDVRHDAILTIIKNVGSLAQVVGFNTQYSRTTNSTNFFGAAARQAKFLSAHSGPLTISNGFSYYPMVIRVQISKTTDRDILNLGWHYWYTDTNDGNTKKRAKFKVRDIDADFKDNGEVDASEPSFLDLSGQKSDEPTVLTYRWLEETPYTGLML